MTRSVRLAATGVDWEVRVVEDVAQGALAVFLEDRPATILLSGGSTPRRLYDLLSGLDYPWSGVEAFFGDERRVPLGSPDSNFAMADRALLSKVPIRAHPIEPETGAEGYEATLRERFAGSLPLFDLAIYGLGPDGHTASLFPGRPEVGERRRWVVDVPEAGQPPYVPRVSLTVPALSAAATGLFLISGEAKREALGRLLAGDPIPAGLMAPARGIIVADAASLPPPRREEAGRPRT